MRDEALEFAQCMREHGVDMPDPTFDAGAVRDRISGRERRPDPFDADKFRRSVEACQKRPGSAAASADLASAERAAKGRRWIAAAARGRCGAERSRSASVAALAIVARRRIGGAVTTSEPRLRRATDHARHRKVNAHATSCRRPTSTARSGFGETSDLVARGGGHRHRPAAAGTIVDRGGDLIEIDGKTVVVAVRRLGRCGATLAKASSDGPDVQQLEENLIALGFATADELDATRSGRGRRRPRSSDGRSARRRADRRCPLAGRVQAGRGARRARAPPRSAASPAGRSPRSLA